MEGFGQFLPIILLFIAMYFLFILPQSKKAKKEKKFILNGGKFIIHTPIPKII